MTVTLTYYGPNDQRGAPVVIVGPRGGGAVLTRTTTTTAVSGQTIAADTTSAPWTLTLPAGGGIVTVTLDDGDTGNALTIAGNGATIDGAATDDTLPSGWTVTFMRAAAAAAWSYSYGA